MDNIQKTGPKDVFGHLLALIGLYVCVLSFGALLFGLIDIYFPDILSYNYGQVAERGLTWPLAILVIVFPLYVWLTAFLQKDLERNPLKRELRIRKWLLYFTLAAASVAIVIDLVALIYRFLNGDLTTQFVLKVFVVLALAFSIFTYYLWNIRMDISATKHPKMRLFVYSVLFLAVASIVWGFFVSGSPFAERMKRFDERRVQDLQTIQYEVINYWQAKETLPETLDMLRDDIRGFVSPRDPETGESYRYAVTGLLQFELCAVFATSNKTDDSSGTVKPTAPPLREAFYDPRGYPNENWQHGAGESCFTRTIDPELYPPFKR